MKARLNCSQRNQGSFLKVAMFQEKGFVVLFFMSHVGFKTIHEGRRQVPLSKRVFILKEEGSFAKRLVLLPMGGSIGKGEVLMS